MKRTVKPWLLAGICALLTFGVDFCVIPRLGRGLPDPVWMTLMILLPVLLAAALFRLNRECSLGIVFAGLAVEYLLLIVFAKPISVSFGASVAHTLGWFSYIGAAFPWPLVVTFAQYITLKILKSVKR